MATIKKPTPERLKEYRLSPLAFIEDMVVLENNKIIQLEDWQRELLKNAFERDANGNLKFNIILFSVPKKNGKTSILSSILLWALFAHTPNAEVFCLSGDRDQARISFDKVAKMIMRNPLLRDSCKVNKNEIYVEETDSVLRVISSDGPSNHGNNASFVAVDELWQFEGSKDSAGRELWYAMTHSPTRESVTMVTTYAGSDTNSLLYELYDRGIKNEDPRQFTFWSEENLASWITPEYLEQQRMRLPASVYQRLHENKWVGGSNGFFTRQDVMQCRDEFLKPKNKGEIGRQYYYGCDLGLVRDKSVAVILSQNKDGTVVVDSIKTWQGDKLNPVKIEDIEQDILLSAQNFPRLKVVVDPWNLKGSIERLKRYCKIEEYTFTGSNVDKLSRNLYYYVHNGLLKFYPHSDLEKELLSLNLLQKSYGYRFDHPSSQFSDHAMALSMALMQVDAVRKPIAGVLFTESPTMEQYHEKLKAEELARSNIKEVEVKSEIVTNKEPSYPTLKTLELWRKLKK